MKSVKGNQIKSTFFWKQQIDSLLSKPYVFRCDNIASLQSSRITGITFLTSNQNQAYSGTANRSSVLSCHSASTVHTHNERFRKMLQEDRRLHQGFLRRPSQWLDTHWQSPEIALRSPSPSPRIVTEVEFRNWCDKPVSFTKDSDRSLHLHTEQCSIWHNWKRWQEQEVLNTEQQEGSQNRPYHWH